MGSAFAYCLREPLCASVSRTTLQLSRYQPLRDMDQRRVRSLIAYCRSPAFSATPNAEATRMGSGYGNAIASSGARWCSNGSYFYEHPPGDHRQTGSSACCKQLFSVQISAPRVQLASSFSARAETPKLYKYSCRYTARKQEVCLL
jgi:hypothetical protein